MGQQLRQIAAAGEEVGEKESERGERGRVPELWEEEVLEREEDGELFKRASNKSRSLGLKSMKREREREREREIQNQWRVYNPYSL